MHLEDLVVPDATFGCSDLTTFCRLEQLGLVVVGQRLEPGRAVLACRVLEADDGTEGWCRRCGCAGRPRDTVTRELAHEPLGWRPTTLLAGLGAEGDRVSALEHRSRRPKGLASRGTPPTTRSWPRADGC